MNFLKSSIFAGCALVCVFSFSHQAGARDFADIYTDCGLGAMIAPKTPAVAAVTNVTWDLGTTAISSNISSPETCAGGKAKTAAFIYRSYNSLESDIARGEGKYLNTLLELIGTTPDNRGTVIQNLRQDFATLIAAPQYSEKTTKEKSEALYNVVYGPISTARS